MTKIIFKNLYCWLLIPLIIYGIFLAHLESPLRHCADCQWSIYTAKSIYKQGNHNLWEYRDKVYRSNYGIYPIGNKFYNFFPPGSAYFAIPVVAVFTEFPGIGISFLSSIESEKSTAENPQVDVVKSAPHMEKLVASLAIALTALFIYLIARQKLSIPLSWLITLIFSFGTSAWSVASRALWSHAPSMLMLAIALYLLLKLNKNKSSKFNYLLALACGIVLAFSYIIRPSNALSIAAFGLLFLSFRNLKIIISYILGLALLLLPFCYLSQKIYGTYLPPYFSSSRLYLRPDFAAVFFAQLFSPSRGFLIFTPVFFLGVFGLIYNVQEKKDLAISLTLSLIILLHLIAISSIPSWWGGTTYGPRFMSDMLPYCIFFLVAAIARLNKLSFSKQLFIWPVFALTTLLSFWIHARGVYCSDTAGWNNKPVSVNRNTHRIFEWSDPQFLRGYNFKSSDTKYLCRNPLL